MKYFNCNLNNNSILKFSIFIFNLFFLIFNLIILIYNLFINVHYKQILTKQNISFKITDYFSVELSKLTYKVISKYLNQKYNNKNILFNNTNIIHNKKLNKTKKIITIHCVDLFGGQIRFFKNILKDDNYIIKYDSNNPDYLINLVKNI